MMNEYRDFENVDVYVSKIVSVVNFPPKQIGLFISNMLTLGVPDAEGNVVLLPLDYDVPLGGKMF